MDIEERITASGEIIELMKAAGINCVNLGSPTSVTFERGADLAPLLDPESDADELPVEDHPMGGIGEGESAWCVWSGDVNFRALYGRRDGVVYSQIDHAPPDESFLA